MRSRLLERLSAAGTSACFARAILLVGIVVLLPAAAYGHKLNVFASAEGRTIRGKAYFRGGAPAQDVAVTALGPAGQPIGQARTDAEGRFALEARYRCDYRLLVETGDGHGGEYTVMASALPKELPPLSADGDRKADADAVQSPAQHVRPQPAAAVAVTAEQLESLSAKIDHLEEQLMAYEDRLRVADVLGGIGYIVGITGAAYYYLGARRKRPAIERAGPHAHAPRGNVLSATPRVA